MPHLLTAILLLAPVAQPTPSTPAQQYKALLKEYNPVSGGMRKAQTDLERKAAVERIGAYPSRFIALAEKHSQDPIAVVALTQAVQALGTTDSAAQMTWEMNGAHFPSDSNDETAGKLVALLLRDHVKSDRVGLVCDRMRYGYRLEFEKFLRAVLEENPHRDVEALTCLSLAQFLSNRLKMLQLARDRPDLARRFEVVFGKDYLPELQRRERAGLARQIEKLFERATQYDDVKAPHGDTIAEKAKTELYALRHLSVGKIAPDIEGPDQDGKQFKLSDNRGKVVLLYFWMEY
ncbi:MAG: hypothetical protein CMJ48_13850 [Planctomycetaceae bacterium]|nr:hypothetical protein [Planctomycetaceae bacterium]